QTDQANLAQVIRAGSAADRHKAIRQVLAIAPQQRSDMLWSTAADELSRVALEGYARTDALRAGEQIKSLGEDHPQYVDDLVAVVAQWPDARALKPLIAIANGMIATQAIVRFGEASVPQLIDAARNGHISQKGGVLHALQILIEGSSLPPYNV